MKEVSADTLTGAWMWAERRTQGHRKLIRCVSKAF